MNNTSSIQDISFKVSKYLHPLIFVNISSWIVNIYVYNNLFIAFINPFILLLCLTPGIIYIKTSKNKENGKYNRTNAFIIILIGFMAAIVIFIVKNTPNVIILDAIVAFIVIMITMIINRIWWDIIFHAAIPMCCTALLIPVSITIAVICALFAIMVGISRVPIKQHSLTQVIAGWLFGFSFTLFLLNMAIHL